MVTTTNETSLNELLKKVTTAFGLKRILKRCGHIKDEHEPVGFVITQDNKEIAKCELELTDHDQGGDECDIEKLIKKMLDQDDDDDKPLLRSLPVSYHGRQGQAPDEEEADIEVSWKTKEGSGVSAPFTNIGQAYTMKICKPCPDGIRPFCMW